MHPCCNGSLQTGTKIIAIVHLLFAILTVAFGVIIFSGGALATYFIHNDQAEMPVDERETAAAHGKLFGGSFGMFIGICIIVGGVLSILSSAVLLSGANKRNHTRCLIWFVLHAILLAFHLLIVIGGASLSEVPPSGPHIASSIIRTLIQSYLLWVVWAFMAEIKETVEVAFYGGLKPKV